MTLTVVLGLASALCWGAPAVWLAQATRRVGPLATAFGSILIGLVAVSPGALFVDVPQWTARGVGLAVATGLLSAAGYIVGFTAFRTGAVSIVAPIIACEGGVAAVIAIAGGERPSRLVAAFIPVAVAGVVLAAMGRGGGKAAVAPAVGAALVWGTVLVLSAPVADDLGVYWGFVLVRGTALLALLPFALKAGAVRGWARDPWRVAAWGLGDSAAYLLFVAAAGRGPVAVASVLAAQFATVSVLAGHLSGERLLRRQLIGVAMVIAAVSGIAAASA